ncbi:MAG: ATP synthase F1 subunit delta [Bacteroidetes bacterium]|nr:ATP synthase F1 subunit delta [Bacteroidota bacterium]
MKGTRASTRYAKSLADLATEQGVLDKVYADMILIDKICKASHELSLFLRNPIIKTDKKEKILKQIFSGKISKLTELFINLLTEKRRESFLESIAESFVDQYKERKKILTAIITTADGLDEDLRKKVLQLVKSSAYSEVELVEKTDKNIIGGFALQVGDKRVDASIAKQVRKLAMAFTENPYIKEY